MIRQLSFDNHSRILLLVALLLASPRLFAQTISDVSFEKQGPQLVVKYSLDKSCDIRMRVSTNKGLTYSLPLQNLSGDVGRNIEKGERQILAYDLTEIRGVEDSLLRFCVEVDDHSAEIRYQDNIIKMMPVEGGTFQMGCVRKGVAKHSYEAELPVHDVSLNGYYISSCEITQRLWVAIMGDNPSRWQTSDSLPVEQVSWNDVQIFIARLSQLTGYRFRLPTEAEWEYAARGGNRTNNYVFPGTDGDLGAYCWYGSNSGNVTHPVGQKKPNELGLYDMGGNVAEWCCDWMEPYTATAAENPRGPKRGENRILRGGSINSPSWGCTVSDRSWYLPDHSYGCYGFRLVLDSVEKEEE